MGRYYPHGDRPAYDALVGMTQANNNVALFDSQGNWGSFSSDSCAAMRYTETKLSKFSDNVIFNSFYMPVVDMCPNYDGSYEEPVLLPALLPVILLNGRQGIAPGVTTNIPKCTVNSVLKLLDIAFDGTPLTPKQVYTTIRFKTLYGGKEQLPTLEEEIKERKTLVKFTKGRATLKSTYEYNEKTRTITVSKFADVGKIEKLLGKLQALPFVVDARDDSTKNDKYGIVTIILKKSADEEELAKRLAVLDKILTSKENYVLNFTERYLDTTNQGKAKIKPMSLTDMLNTWVAWRVELEKRACTFWIAKSDKDIRYLEILIKAVDNRKIIIESLDRECTNKELEQWLAKKLDITDEEAHIIYELKVRQLRALEKKELLVKKQDCINERKGLAERKAKPLPSIKKQLATFKFEFK
jgi:DNA gyrase subunit A